MAPMTEVYNAVSIPPHLLSRLQSHLPFSLPLLRRLQFATRNTGGSTPNARIIYVHDGQEKSEDNQHPFAAGYVDFSRGPETESWIYSTLQDAAPQNIDPASTEHSSVHLSPEVKQTGVDQLLALLRQMRAIEAEYAGGEDTLDKGHSRGHVRIGAMHETVRQLLIATGVTVRKTSVVPLGQDWEFYATWLVRVEGLRAADTELPEGMQWDAVRPNDTQLIISRTSIPKRSDTILTVPSVAIRLQNGQAIAWGYLGVDGSVSTLHVEEPYRGKGLAKALTCRLLRYHLGDFGDDGWGSTDISTTNEQSQGVFKSIGGMPAWLVSWMYLDLTTVGDPL